ncbi:RNA 2',3'-cyclic phosphodiesterase [Metabacillus litoralis]|uniref:RNA 2',3'-cyclic phosphodiesterase n=1 Tax=Metabacillus TaxID=2675233 RepID=UPI001B9A5506|nr:RNA 2',3'-cyclic phosphodiesterase [Metabacillus litoralis]MCM3162773.1 RNA 2',3'-cyclic phosphodiesterase [Metabacillus litoralis]MCM3410941.1 RNA 2',3'-cyclic phosphodiesterase [Metabacillus litoralis]UHA62164.1 RNA 2',3'-cyclic phosphodiesterase [Metabacillus litoralis]
MKKHYFIAVPIEEHHQQLIQNWITTYKNKLPFQSWVHPNDYHITLAFLGDVGEVEKLELLVEKIQQVVQFVPHFDLMLKGIDVFGKQDAPRIFWAGVKESMNLQHLQKQVFDRCQEVGFQLDKKPFRPHITLARKWKSEEPFRKWPQLDHAFEGSSSHFHVKKIHLYQTNLNKIPKYEVVETFPLKTLENETE